MSAHVLRIYDPAECDPRGVPLDWERCRACSGTGRTPSHLDLPREGECWTCDGHGSLKAAALEYALRPQGDEEVARRIGEFDHDALPADTTAAVDQILADAKRTQMVAAEARAAVMAQPRCDDCGHPMSEGTWEPRSPQWEPREGIIDGVGTEAWALAHLRNGDDPPREILGSAAGTHYSPCDDGCSHGGHALVRDGGSSYMALTSTAEDHAAQRQDEPDTPLLASWRPVDVRTLGWPHDLRPEKLAVLCLRCWAARARRSEGSQR